MALPKKYRLTKDKEFARLKQEGRLYSHPYLGILVLESKENFVFQFGFIISIKVARKAHQRFKLKRQLAEIVYSFLPKLKNNFQIIFLPKKTLAGKPFLEI